MNVEKKALNILSSLRNLSTKHSKKELEKATQILLEISTNPTVSVLKGVLDRSKKRKQKTDKNSDQTNNEEYGFLRGAKYFGGNKK
ncbi:hypothetical protein ACFQ3N_01975 [Virgibacillus byunsanensis]|uniref:Uncharacterized protein n=1 Tax=Virgibacillus byunsanensis TaxID=570945 RepID=A0ABW3LJS0_9BACI